MLVTLFSYSASCWPFHLDLRHLLRKYASPRFGCHGNSHGFSALGYDLDGYFELLQSCLKCIGLGIRDLLYPA